jgi:chemotaxis protein methyltransferase CheR
MAKLKDFSMMNELAGISFEQLDDVVELVNKLYGFNFDGYSRASLKRRVSRIMTLYNLDLFDLKALLVNNKDFFEDFLMEVTVNVTEMFRDPDFFKAVRKEVLPYLSSFQRIKIWNAGCSTGEEVYSYSIMLEEENLYNRSFLYGTDINTSVLNTAKKGIYDLKKMKLYTENYQAAGGKHSLSEYYVARYDAASIQSRLKKNTLFSVHNLVSDGVFNEFQLISCRNVLIYFNTELQEKVIKLFYDSLCPFGFLCLGSREVLRGEEIAGRFKAINKEENIYQKIA